MYVNKPIKKLHLYIRRIVSASSFCKMNVVDINWVWKSALTNGQNFCVFGLWRWVIGTLLHWCFGVNIEQILLIFNTKRETGQQLYRNFTETRVIWLRIQCWLGETWNLLVLDNQWWKYVSHFLRAYFVT